MDFVNKTVARFARTKNVKVRKFYSKLLLLTSGLDIGVGTQVGHNVNFKHGGLGTVIHTNTIIEDNCMIMSNVTVGRSDIWKPRTDNSWGGVHLKQGVILCTGARVIGKKDTLVVGENTIIGANAVLTCSTGANEIWAGIPARKVKDRDDKE